MRPVILRHKWLFLVGVLCVLAGCGHKSPPPAQAEMPTSQSPSAEPTQAPEQTQLAQVPEQQQEPEVEKRPDKEVTVKGYSAITNDIPKAENEALMDAHNKAIAQGLGVKVYGKTVVKQFQVVEQVVMTERKGYIKSFEILDRNPASELGYEVTVKAVVSNEPISDLDDLKFTINLMGNPRLMVYVDSKVADAGVIEGYVTGPLNKAGYRLVDRRQMEKIIERDFEQKKLLGDWEAAAILGKRLGADVSIMGDVSAEVTGRVSAGRFPLITARANVSFRVVATETGEILYIITDEDIASDSGPIVGSGNTDEAAVTKAISGAMDKVADKLMWELPAKIGLVTVRLRLSDCTYEQADQLTRLVKPLSVVEDASLLSYQGSIAEIDVRTSGKTQDLASHLGSIQDMNLEIQGVALGAVEVRVLKTEPGPVESN